MSSRMEEIEKILNELYEQYEIKGALEVNRSYKEEEIEEIFGPLKRKLKILIEQDELKESSFFKDEENKE